VDLPARQTATNVVVSSYISFFLGLLFHQGPICSWKRKSVRSGRQCGRNKENPEVLCKWFPLPNYEFSISVCLVRSYLKQNECLSVCLPAAERQTGIRRRKCGTFLSSSFSSFFVPRCHWPHGLLRSVTRVLRR
jgi:hypothetical protein